MLKARDGDFFISDWLQNRSGKIPWHFGNLFIILAVPKQLQIECKGWVEKTNAIGLKATAG